MIIDAWSDNTLIALCLQTMFIAVRRSDAVNEDSAVGSVLMVCFTNECRSPIASAVFNNLVKSRGLDSRWHSDSAGIAVNATIGVNANNNLTPVLQQHGICLTDHRTKKVNLSDFDKFDYMLGIDEYSVEYLQYLQLILHKGNPPRGNRTKVELLSAYDPKGLEPLRSAPGEGCAEPEFWYRLAYRSCNAFLDKISAKD